MIRNETECKEASKRLGEAFPGTTSREYCGAGDSICIKLVQPLDFTQVPERARPVWTWIFEDARAG